MQFSELRTHEIAFIKAIQFPNTARKHATLQASIASRLITQTFTSDKINANLNKLDTAPFSIRTVIMQSIYRHPVVSKSYVTYVMQQHTLEEYERPTPTADVMTCIEAQWWSLP